MFGFSSALPEDPAVINTRFLLNTRLILNITIPHLNLKEVLISSLK